MDGGLLSLKWNNHRSSFIHMLSSLRKKDVYCDVTLACDGKFYPTHKLVLSTCSEYFQEMFQHTECKHPIIVLKDMKSEDLESLLNYMYMGEVNILQDKLSTLIKAAECLKIKGLAVPDDPPGEKRSNTNDSNPDSKRRKTDSRSHSLKSTKSPDRFYKSSDSFVSQKEQFPCDSQNYDYNSEQSTAGNFGQENSSTNKEVKEEQTIHIKQEPSDNVIDLEDSKEGILESSHTAFPNVLPRVESSKSDNIEASDAQNIWGSESHSSDSYPTFDADNPANTNEEDDQNESVYEKEDYVGEADIEKSFSQRVRRYSLPSLPDSHNTVKSSPSTTQESYLASETCSLGYLSSQTHESRPTFSCNLCSYVGYHKCNLIKHLVIHSGTKPFSCPHCSFKSAQKGNVKTHMKKKHPLMPLVKL